MRSPSVIYLLVVCLCVCSAPLHAGGPEIAPFLGFQFGGEFEDSATGQRYDIGSSSAAEALFTIDLSDINQLEFYFSRQETEVEGGGLFPTETLFDLDIDYYHIGGTLLMQEGPWQPFVVSSLGATHLSPEPSSVDSLTRLSLDLGGGLRYLPNEHLGLYLAGRGFLTFIDSQTHITVRSGSTTIQMTTDGLWQGILQAGLIFRF